MVHYYKDPSAVLDWEFDWSDWLASGESITTHSVTTAGAGVAVDSSSVSNGVVTAWLSGGTAGRRADVTCEIVTSEGRTDQRTIPVTIKER